MSKREQIRRLRNGLESYCEKKGVDKVSELTISISIDTSEFTEQVSRVAKAMSKLHKQLKEDCVPYREVCELREKIQESWWPLSLWYKLRLWAIRRQFIEFDMKIDHGDIEFKSVEQMGEGAGE